MKTPTPGLACGKHARSPQFEFPSSAFSAIWGLERSETPEFFQGFCERKKLPGYPCGNQLSRLAQCRVMRRRQ